MFTIPILFCERVLSPFFLENFGGRVVSFFPVKIKEEKKRKEEERIVLFIQE